MQLSSLVDGAGNVFEWWRKLYRAQGQWAGVTYPPLLWNFGVSLVERAVIDAFCRATGQTFAQAVRSNSFGVELGSIHEELKNVDPTDLLPVAPRRSMLVRHTVGMGDPLRDCEIPTSERTGDELPQSLESSIREYGLTHFKIKLAGKIDVDLERLRDLARLFEGRRCAFTLDGNENFRELGPFRELWSAIVADRSLNEWMRNLIFVEQPLHRDVAMSAQCARELLAWKERPPMIIDESDATINSLPRALESGYVGTSHKNCKGIFKGIANACLIEHRRRSDPSRQYMLSGEDLANVGPVALMQDLAVLAVLGILHAERNGHHYFKGLDAFAAGVQEGVLRGHPDLYKRANGGFATLAIREGAVNLETINAAPFGTAFDLDPSQFTPLDHWKFESL
jgi:hypothetical protein